MTQVHVIILAAGKSSRLYPLTLNCPKSLLEFESEPLLVRTLQQVQAAGFTSIRIVIGHLYQQIKDALKNFQDSVEFIYNERYATDTNSLSLYLGLTGLNNVPVLVIEADVVLAHSCWPIIRQACKMTSSVWFTQGLFLPHQKGGIIKSDATRKITDMKIVPHFDADYASYSKNLGILYIGPNEINTYQAILEKKVAKSTASYYMEHWIQHLPELACDEINLFPHPAGSFNTQEELELCRQYVKSSA